MRNTIKVVTHFVVTILTTALGAKLQQFNYTVHYGLHISTYHWTKVKDESQLFTHTSFKFVKFFILICYAEKRESVKTFIDKNFMLAHVLYSLLSAVEQ